MSAWSPGGSARDAHRVISGDPKPPIPPHHETKPLLDRDPSSLVHGEHGPGEEIALGLLWWRDPFLKTAALIGICLILILPRFLARPFLVLGLLVMAGRVAVAFFLHR